jgi:hypothetical protein
MWAKQVFVVRWVLDETEGAAGTWLMRRYVAVDKSVELSRARIILH